MGNTAVTRLERTLPRDRVYVRTKLVKYLAKCQQGNTAVTRLERTSPRDRVYVRTKLENTSLSAHSKAAMGPPIIAAGCWQAPAEALSVRKVRREVVTRNDPSS